MRAQGWTVWFFLTGLVLTVLAASGPQWTAKHEAGRCAIRGHCGHQGFFGTDLPCTDNGPAHTPDDDLRDQIVALCGDEWQETDVCCTKEQVSTLKDNLKTANNIVGSCPACKKNFFDLFCTFTCSPDQSLFVNITQVQQNNATTFRVTELDQLISDEYGSGFYNSCREVKFVGGRAMNLIGGGAKNYSELLTFLGEKKFGGSPFQINFPRPNDRPFEGMETVLSDAKECNSSDSAYRCACVDCPSSCPTLEPLEEVQSCYVGLLPCLSFGIIIAYSIFITLLVLAVTGHAAAARRRKSKNERLQLLQDAHPSDDEDEADLPHDASGVLDRPTKQYVLNTLCDRGFSSLARVCATFPATTIGSSILVVVLLSFGWLRFAVETDPVKLWVAPDSAAAQEKQFFDDNFGPFFRSEQAFLVNNSAEGGAGPVLSYETLKWWFNVEKEIESIKTTNGYTLEGVCYKPTGDACVIQSISQYDQGFDLNPDTWKEDLQACVDQPVNCRPAFGQPLAVEYLLGGYNYSSGRVTDAEAMIVTWVVNNYNPGDPRLAKAEEFEQELKNKLLTVQEGAEERGLRLSFSTEISLEEELNKNTNTDAKIVAVSYIVMFIYASLALGSTTVTAGTILRNPTSALVQSKFSLGVVGILIVLMSVSASVGLFAAAGVKATLIIAEVIPFLVLAVGVDNIFLIVHEFERVNISHADEPIDERIGRALGRMGPSILLSATTETVAFALGAAVGMPAVRNFAAYAAGAVFFNALLQMTMFVAVLTLNQERVEAGRVDCVPCITLKHGLDSGLPNGYGGAPFSGAEEEGALTRFIRKVYAPAILGSKTRVAIMVTFLGFLTAGIALLPEVQLGLDQRVAIPSDSYLIDYFTDLYDYFGAGPPLYFVTRETNITERAHQLEVCGRFAACNEYSLANILEQERKRPEVSYVSDAAAVWFDDFFSWLDPINPCCFTDPEDENSPTCLEDRDPPFNSRLIGMPEGEEFIEYAERWLDAPILGSCYLGGKAAYGDAVVLDKTRLTINASHFRTSHTPLRSQEDFINAYANARRIAKDISERDGIDVFPYSKFYIFFDQYASIVRLSTALVGAALAFILFITSLLLGSVSTGLVVTITVIMIVVDIVGTMAVAGVSLNALSLVNIIICVGIGVEFCAHIARAFTVPSPSILERAPYNYSITGRTPGGAGKQARAWAALVNVGGSVFSGITITKLLGVFVLAFTRSKIFEIYYFRVWLSLVVWAALHALVFLPVALSFFGGRGYVDPEGDGGLEQDLASRRYRALLPEDEYDSDDY